MLLMEEEKAHKIMPRILGPPVMKGCKAVQVFLQQLTQGCLELPQPFIAVIALTVFGHAESKSAPRRPLLPPSERDPALAAVEGGCGCIGSFGPDALVTAV
jgi:hypothetical protein